MIVPANFTNLVSLLAACYREFGPEKMTTAIEVAKMLNRQPVSEDARKVEREVELMQQATLKEQRIEAAMAVLKLDRLQAEAWVEYAYRDNGHGSYHA